MNLKALLLVLIIAIIAGYDNCGPSSSGPMTIPSVATPTATPPYIIQPPPINTTPTPIPNTYSISAVVNLGITNNVQYFTLYGQFYGSQDVPIVNCNGTQVTGAADTHDSVGQINMTIPAPAFQESCYVSISSPQGMTLQSSNFSIDPTQVSIYINQNGIAESKDSNNITLMLYGNFGSAMPTGSYSPGSAPVNPLVQCSGKLLASSQTYAVYTSPLQINIQIPRSGVLPSGSSQCYIAVQTLSGIESNSEAFTISN